MSKRPVYEIVAGSTKRFVCIVSIFTVLSSGCAPETQLATTPTVVPPPLSPSQIGIGGETLPIDPAASEAAGTGTGSSFAPPNTDLTPIEFYAAMIAGYSPGPGVGAAFADPSLALGGPLGFGSGQGSLDVVTLGAGGSLTVGFDEGGQSRAIFNGFGDDFIVFENAFALGSNQGRGFAELAYVDVSSDGRTFVRFPVTSQTAGAVSAFGTIRNGDAVGFAGSQPTRANVEENDIDPFDPGAAGGDSFDLADLGGAPEVVGGQVDLNNIRFVRIVDVIGNGSQQDRSGQAIFDPFDADSNKSADIDAISVINGREAE